MKIDKTKPRAIQKLQEITFKSMNSHGLNTVQSCIMAYLQIQTDEVSIEDIKKTIGYSTASISTTIKFLEKNHLVKTHTKPGSKKIFIKSQKSPLNILVEKSKMMKKEFIKEKEEMPKIISEIKILFNKEKNETKKNYYQEQLNLLKKQEKEKKIIKEIMMVLQKELQKRGLVEE